jgi:hypothetical protein
MTTILLIIFTAPIALLSACVVGLGWELAKLPFDRERRAMRADIDRLLQREWDLTRQLNAVTWATAVEGMTRRRPVVLGVSDN